MPLAQELLCRRPDRSAEAGVALVSAVAFALAPEPLSEDWQRLLIPFPEGLCAPAAARLRVLDWMVKIERQAGERDWSAGRFPSSDPIWQQDVKSLEDTDRERVLAWCLELCTRSGLSEPEEARGLIRLLHAVDQGSPDAVAASINRLLCDRDPVTRVLVATAFARDALESSRWDPDQAKWLVAIVKRFDRSTRRLLAQHLLHRFGWQDSQHETRLRQLGQAADLPGLRAPLAAAKAVDSEPRVPHEERRHLVDTVGLLFRHWKQKKGGKGRQNG